MARVAFLDFEKGRTTGILHQTGRMMLRHSINTIFVGVLVAPFVVFAALADRADGLRRTGLGVFEADAVNPALNTLIMFAEPMSLLVLSIAYPFAVSRMVKVALWGECSVASQIVGTLRNLPRIIFLYAVAALILFVVFTFGSGVAELGPSFAQAFMIVFLLTCGWVALHALPLAGILASDQRNEWGGELLEAAYLVRRRRFSVLFSAALVLVAVIGLYGFQEFVWKHGDVQTGLVGMALAKILMFWLLASYQGAIYLELSGSRLERP